MTLVPSDRSRLARVAVPEAWRAIPTRAGRV